MKQINIIILSAIVFFCFFSACTKIQDGFLSPYIVYPVKEFSFVRGRVTTSTVLNFDGSAAPLNVQAVHYYDSTGKTVDNIFFKKYLVGIWTEVYNPLTDKDYASISAKRSVDSLPPIYINPSNGQIATNSGSINLPLGWYTIDMQVTNSAGTSLLKNAVKITISDGKAIELDPETGAFSNSLLRAGSGSGAGALGGANNGVFFNGQNNPYDQYTLTRIADTPNIFILKVTDRDGVPFSPKSGEIMKRPGSGLNPNPPFLQNLQDYAPDTYVATDTAMSIRFPLVPFPLASLGNGFNMYYVIKSNFVSIDSTSAWSSNTAGNFYKGITDSHYKGVYTNGRFDYSIRVPMRIFVPGKYMLSVKVLNSTHK